MDITQDDLAGLSFISPWTYPGTAVEPEAGARHTLFREMVLGILRTECPWLLQMLERSGAQILARQGAFYVAVPPGSDDWIEIPPLSARLYLMPWAEDNEIAQ